MDVDQCEINFANHMHLTGLTAIFMISSATKLDFTKKYSLILTYWEIVAGIL